MVYWTLFVHQTLSWGNQSLQQVSGKSDWFFLLFFWLRWVFMLCAGFLQLRRARAALCRGEWASCGGGLSCCRAQALGHASSAAVVHGLSCSVACGIFFHQGSNPRPLHWQADSSPLYREKNRAVPIIFLLHTRIWLRVVPWFAGENKWFSIPSWTSGPVPAPPPAVYSQLSSLFYVL